MLQEKNLVVGGKYLYWSSKKLCHIRIVYVGKRVSPFKGNENIFVFRDTLTLNEIWTESLFNIVVDNGWLEKFVNEKTVFEKNLG